MLLITTPRPYLGLFLVLILALGLSACDNSTDEAADTTTTDATATLALTATDAPPTATRISATLPPPQTIEVQRDQDRPTRTLAPSITPRPSATSNLNIPITPSPTGQEPEAPPQEDAPAEAPPPDDAETVLEFVIGYDDITRELRAIDLDSDILDVQSMAVEYQDTGPKLVFDILQPTRVNYTADVNFEYASAEGIVYVRLGSIYQTGNPNAALPQEITDFMNELLEDAMFDIVTELATQRVGEGTGFRVSDFIQSSTGLTIEITTG